MFVTMTKEEILVRLAVIAPECDEVGELLAEIKFEGKEHLVLEAARAYDNANAAVKHWRKLHRELPSRVVDKIVADWHTEHPGERGLRW